MTLIPDVTALPTSAEEYEATFTPGNIITELLPGTLYKLCLEYAGGDASNYALVHCSAVASGGVAYTHNGTSWTADTTKNPIVGLKPGMPPKLKYAIVENSRLFGIEGDDGEHPGYLWYSAAGNPYDWSTPDGGGYVSPGDEDAATFPIGAIAGFYNDVWVFGTTKQPYLGRLSGASPAAYTIAPTLQQVAADQASTIVTPNDILFCAPSGVSSISTMQEYGDIRSTTLTDGIKRVFQIYGVNGAIAGYEPNWGLYLLQLPGYDKVICLHPRMQSVRNQGMFQQMFAPVTMWEFAFPGVVTSFGAGNNCMYIGTDNGNVYRVDGSVVEDDNMIVSSSFRTGYQTTGIGELAAKVVGFSVFGRFGGSFDINFYRNSSRTEIDSISTVCPWDTTIPVMEMIIDVEEMGWMVNPETYYDREYVNFNFRSLMVGVDNIDLNGHPLWFGQIEIMCDRIGGF
jgi:hypothetical protein